MNAYIACPVKCGLTAGCPQCNPIFIGSISDNEAIRMKEEIQEFKERLDKDFDERFKKFWL